MCTSIGYTDAAGRAYFGRTLELTTDLPYQMALFPVGFAGQSAVAGHAPLAFTTRHAVLAVTMPDRVPTASAPMAIADLKILEGLNDQGLTFSVLSYPSAGGKQRSVDATSAVLAAADLGLWVLGQHASVAEVKASLAGQPVLLAPIAILGGLPAPFHYTAHDATGASIVIEFDHGAMTVYDNPVGVMTNGPKFDWHLTNLDNYTFLSNVDKPTATFGSYHAAQPDSGIATAGLPSSSTSVGRFVRAVYYAEFSEKAASPEGAVKTLAHILNNFDRPRGASIDYPEEGVGHLEVAGLPQDGTQSYATEFTCWTSLSDLDRRLFHVRDYQALNFTRFDLGALAGETRPAVVPLSRFIDGAFDGTDLLRGA